MSDTNLLLTIDWGASGTKVLLGKDDKLYYQYLDPATVELPASILERHQKETQVGTIDPENDAWVQVEGEDSAHAVGKLARQLYAQNQLSDLKFEEGLYKVLCAVGLAAERYGTVKTLTLAALLPYGEYLSHEIFRESLGRSLARFRFRGKLMRVKLKPTKRIKDGIKCLPEGGGLMMSRRDRYGEAWKDMTLSVLMFGYRNLSVLRFVQGRRDYGETSNLGFCWLVERVKELTAGQDAESLAPAIFNIGDRFEPSHPSITTLLRTRKEEYQQREREQIVAAIKTAREEYWLRVSAWLDRVVPPGQDEVTLAGGTAAYLMPLLKDYFGQTQTYTAKNVREEAAKKLRLPNGTNALSWRFADVYLAHQQLAKEMTDGR